MPNILIRTATLEDLPVLQPLCISIYTQSFGDHWNEGGLAWYNELVYGTEQLTKDLTSPNVVYSMLYMDGTPVAFMKLKLNSSVGGGNRSETLEVQKLYVAPEEKGKGLGARLMSLAFSKAKELGRKSIRLEVLDQNHAAIAFYQKLGFNVLKTHYLDIPYFKDELRGMLIMEAVL